MAKSKNSKQISNTAKGQKNVDVIMDAALELIIYSGIQKCTLTNLSAATQLSKSHITYYFPQLELIVDLLFDQLITLGQKSTSEALLFCNTLEEKVIGVIDGAFKWILLNPKYGHFFLLMYHLTANDEKIFNLNKQMLATGRQRIESIVKEDLGVEAKSVAHILHMLLVGGLVQMITLNDFNSSQYYRRTVIEGFERVLERSLKNFKA